MLAGDFEVPVGNRGDDQSGNEEDPVEEEAKAINRNRAVESDDLRQAGFGKPRLLPPEGKPREGLPESDEQQESFALLWRRKQPEIKQQNSAAEQRQHERRKNREVIGGGVELGHR